VPRRAEVEPVLGGPTGVVHAQDPAAEAVARLEEHELDVRRAQQPRGLKAGEAGADDGN
jgi:hypothetical protein